MTLRELLDKAEMPVPVALDDPAWERSDTWDDLDEKNLARAQLKALAPVLAALLNDMAEEMSNLMSRTGKCPGCFAPTRNDCFPPAFHKDACPFAALLARYGRLGEEGEA